MAALSGSAEERARELGIELPGGPTPLGAHVEAVRTVIGVASLPLGMPVEVEVTMEVG